MRRIPLVMSAVLSLVFLVSGLAFAQYPQDSPPQSPVGQGTSLPMGAIAAISILVAGGAGIYIYRQIRKGL